MFKLTFQCELQKIEENLVKDQLLVMLVDTLVDDLNDLKDKQNNSFNKYNLSIIIISSIKLD